MAVGELSDRAGQITINERRVCAFLHGASFLFKQLLTDNIYHPWRTFMAVSRYLRRGHTPCLTLVLQICHFLLEMSYCSARSGRCGLMFLITASQECFSGFYLNANPVPRQKQPLAWQIILQLIIFIVGIADPNMPKATSIPDTLHTPSCSLFTCQVDSTCFTPRPMKKQLRNHPIFKRDSSILNRRTPQIWHLQKKMLLQKL